jgi:hypothetical protein
MANAYRTPEPLFSAILRFGRGCYLTMQQARFNEDRGTVTAQPGCPETPPNADVGNTIAAAGYPRLALSPDDLRYTAGRSN